MGTGGNGFELKNAHSDLNIMQFHSLIYPAPPCPEFQGNAL